MPGLRALVLSLVMTVGQGCGLSAPRPFDSTQVESPLPAVRLPIPAFSPIVIVVMENKGFDQVFGNAQAPYLNGLASEYGLAREYYGVAHPSLPNYLALIGGGTFGVASDCLGCFQPVPSLVDQVEAQGRTWKAYFESMPGPCYGGNSPDGRYAQKHNPFWYFDGVRQDPARCARLVPLSELPADLASGALPDLVWIGPDMRHSTHDASIGEGDAWLAGLLPSILAAPAFQQNGLLVITYDEGTSTTGCCGRPSGGGRIMTVVVSPLARRGYVSDTPFDHYALLRTIEGAWGLGYLGHADDPVTSNLGEFFER